MWVTMICKKNDAVTEEALKKRCHNLSVVRVVLVCILWLGIWIL